MQRTLSALVEREYGIRVRRIGKVKDVYRLETREGAMCLKPYKVDASEVDYLAAVFEHLRGRGFRYGPLLYRTKNGRAWVRYGSAYYMLTDWVIGATPDFSTDEPIRKALHTLGKFHRHAEGLSPDSIPAQRRHIHLLPQIVAQYKDSLANCELSGRMGPFMELCDMALHYLDDERCKIALAQEEQAVSFSHGDYNYPNLVSAGGRMHLIDFEASAQQTRMVDLSHILHRNYAWRGNSTLRGVEHYEQKRPLNAETRRLLAALLMAPYPIVRKLRFVQLKRRVRLDLPPQSKIDKYVRYLHQLM